MDNLISDAVSVFMQILMQFAPDHVGDYEFLLTGYIFACLFLLVVIITFCQMLSAFAKSIIGWINRGC